MHILAALPAGANPFISLPPIPRINEPLPSPPPPPLPIPVKNRRSRPSPASPPPHSPFLLQPPLRSVNNATRYYKPVSPGVLSSEGGRAVVVGDSGVSYLLPGAPFEFQFSYSETPKAKPIAIREPAFLPFAPPEMPRPWTGKAPLLSKKDKERKKKIRLFHPLGYDSTPGEGSGNVLEIASRREVKLGNYVDKRNREEILGEPLSQAEVAAVVKPYLSSNRQVNLGRDGLTHNMLNLIHTHWKQQKVCKVRCRGVPTVDMNNVCYHLEEKTGGKIIRRTGGIVYLFRGRNYNPRTRPRYPVMLWRPPAPVYPKLIQEAPEGLTKEEADELRRQGQNLLPICRLAKHGIYLTLVQDVRDAFELSYLVKIDCKDLEPSDYKKIGAKLKEIVPCVLLSFDDDQILIWRGKDWKSRYHTPFSLVPRNSSTDAGTTACCGGTDMSDDHSKSMPEEVATSPIMVSLWRQAVESNKALLLNETELCPDALLERVKDFEGISQANGGSKGLDESETCDDAVVDSIDNGEVVEYNKEYEEDSDDIF
ncbi:hypothetical protein HPP92_010387 [Vanilla planifolia]|uniref:CRM domain-containing protein n=1 Tax=Vanilla planifolia TaxID=51239 RepID=A0A835V2F4_VANPL|nr:hypothetical protein HPP92_010387 [Vanilla planifolia]